MAMATKIEDLPHNIKTELDELKDLQKIDNSNIKADIKKKVSFEDSNIKESDSFLSKLQSEISEENVLFIIKSNGNTNLTYLVVHLKLSITSSGGINFIKIIFHPCNFIKSICVRFLSVNK